ncbi:hypothetical protein ABTY98_19745 [Streptomyces sp. NPDC096040]
MGAVRGAGRRRAVRGPEDVAGAVRHLMDGTSVTGSALPVDGGFTVA